MENKNNNEEKNNVNVNQNENQELEADVKNQNNQHGELQDFESQTNSADANLNNGKTNQLQDTISLLNNIRAKKSTEIENKKVKIKNKSKKIKIISGVVAGVAVVGIAATIICVSLFGKKTYQLTINYGDGTTENVEINKDGKVTNLKEPEVFGYKFEGWFKDAGFSIPFNPDADNISSNTTIYAKLTPKIYKITFLSNNATMQSNSVDVAYNQSYSLPENTFVNNNYKFMGWSLNPNATNEVEIFSPGKAFKLIDEGATYYAIWKGEEKTISYNIQDLRINGTKPTIINTVLNYGDEYTIPNLEELHNGTSNHRNFNKYFLGFKIDGDETNKIYTYGNKLTITNSFHFLEVWQDCTNMLTLQLQGGQTSGQTSYNFVTGHKIKLPNATRENYDFMGWNTKSDGSGTSYLANSEYVIKNSTSDKLYAIWKGQEKQISFEFTNARVNGELPTIETSIINYDNNFTIPTLTGVEHKDKSMYFAGFTIKNDNSGKVYTMGETIKVTQNIVFVEAWEASTNLIKFNLQGGTGNFNNLNFVTGTEINLPESIPTLANYVFMGWNTLSNGLGTMYAAGESYTVQEGIFTLYAIWKGEEKTISFNFTDGLFNIDGVDTPANEILTNKTINYGDNYTVESFDGIHVVGYDYNFIGVKIKDSADATVFAPGETITITGNITLVDVWEKTSNVLNIVNTFDNSTESYNYITGYSFELGVLVPPYFYEEIGYWSGTEESIPQTKEQIMASPYFISNGGTITITDGTQNIYAVYLAVEIPLNFDVASQNVWGMPNIPMVTKTFKYNSSITIPMFNEFNFEIPENITNNWNFTGWGVMADAPWTFLNVFTDGQNLVYNINTLYNVDTFEELFAYLNVPNMTVSEVYDALITEGFCLLAVWEHKQTTITYNANGGTYDEGFESVQNVNTSSYITLPTSGVSKQYHNLIGWSTSPTDQSTVLKSYTTGLEGTTLYAVYERKQVDVSFSVGNGASSGINPFKHGMGLNYELPLNGNLFTKEGYEVVGFDVNGTTYGFGDSVLITENTVISVIWEETQMVKFMNATPENIYFEGGQKISKLTASSVGKTLIMPSVVLDEKEKDVNGTIKYFAGWSTNANDTVPMYFQASSYVITNTKITLYPIYLEETLDCLQFTLNADNESYTVTSNSSSTSSYTLPYMVIPSTYNGKPVNTIQELNAHYSCVIETVILPNSITNIFVGHSLDMTALFDSGLSNRIKYVYIPGSLTHFKNAIFDGTNNSGVLKTVVFGEGVEKVGNLYEGFAKNVSEFADPSTGQSPYLKNAGVSEIRSVSTVVLPDSLKEIGNYAIANNDNLKSIVLPENLEKIWDTAFAANKFDNLIIPASVTYLGEGFACKNPGTPLKPSELTFNNNSNYIIENHMLMNKEKTRLLNLFSSFNETTLTLPSTIQKIDPAAIMGIETLQKLVFGSNVKSVDAYSVFNNNNLTTIELPKEMEWIEAAAFASNPKLTTINWPENIHEIPQSIFASCESLVFNIPNHITKIGYAAFSGNKALTEVAIPGSVKEIGQQAFDYCENISYVYIPASVTTIGARAFTNKNMQIYCDVVSKPAGWSDDWAYGVPTENIHWIQVNFALNADGNSYTVTSPVNTEISGKFIIPKSHNGLPVTGIGDSAFESCSNITEIVIPNSVTEIGRLAFSNCHLRSINLPQNLNSIGEAAFAGCSELTNIILPRNLPVIAESTFNNCSSLKEVVLPQNLEIIGDYAFESCTNLTTIKIIPISLTSIGYSAFSACSSFTSISLLTTNLTTIGDYAFNGCSSLVTVSLPTSLTTIGNQAFRACSALKEIAIPSGVTAIGNYAFDDCTSLATVNLPTSLTTIGEYAFQNCRALTEIAIPSGVTEIGNYAFYDCTSLAAVSLPENLTTIGEGAFQSCNALTEITIPNSVTAIGNYAFYCCLSLTTISLPTNLTTIGNFTFNSCRALKEIVIPNTVTQIGEYAFYDCTSLATVNLPTNLTTIGDFAFQSCSSLTEIVIPSGVTIIEQNTFQGCSSLTTVSLPTNLTTIGHFAFAGCRALTKIAIPSGVTIIGEGAFYQCSITEITIPSVVTEIGGFAFIGCQLDKVEIPASVVTIGQYAFAISSTAQIYCDVVSKPAGWSDDWANGVPAENIHWKQANFVLNDAGTGYVASAVNVSISGEIVIPETYRGLPVTEIGASAFKDCTALTGIVIPNTVTQIGNFAFEGCSALKEIAIPNSVTEIKFYTFNSCTNLTTVNLPTNLTTIENGAFSNCTSLTTISLPTNLTTIGDSAFQRCSSLTEIAIPSGVIAIGNSTFYNCTSLATVSLPTNLTTIGGYAFQSCRLLKEITIPSGVTAIGNSAFDDCTSLAKVEIPASVITIGQYAFGYCTALTEITIPNGVTAIGKSTFSNCTSLAKVEIPASVTTIGESAFELSSTVQIYCDVVSKPAEWNDAWAKDVPAENIHWKQVNYKLNASGTGYVASAADDNISGEVVIPETYRGLPVTEIAASAFANCGSITKIVIPNSVTEIGDSAFAYCISLERLDIPETVEYMGASIFESRTEVQIYCEAISKPAGWSENWATVVPAENIHWGVALQSNINDVAMPNNNNLETDIASFNLSKTVVNSETKNENKRGN